MDDQYSLSFVTLRMIRVSILSFTIDQIYTGVLLRYQSSGIYRSFICNSLSIMVVYVIV